MNATRWKLLMAYLPAVASVVNSFENSEVQAKVFDTLLGALDEKTQFESGVIVSKPLPGGSVATSSTVSPVKDSDGGLDIEDGSSIHSLVGKVRI
jgi:hypothetical protein